MNPNNKNKGFTFLESLLCLIAVTIVTSMLFMLTDIAKKAYIDLEMNAEGQVLCGILTNSIEDELKYTTYITKRRNIHDILDSETSADTGYDGYEFDFISASREVENPADPDTPLSCEGCYFDDSTGKVYLNTNRGNYPLTGASSYVYNVTATVDAYYVPNIKGFYIDLKVHNGDNVIISAPFIVETLNPDKLPVN